MKFDEKLRKISKKSQMRMDRISIILGLSLLIASFCSYYVVEAFAQPVLFEFDCPENAYHGLDNQGNEACRNILTNEILEPESSIIIDSNSEKTKSDSWIINDPETGEIILNGESQIAEIIILALIGIAASIIGIMVKKGKLKIFQRLGLSSVNKGKLKIFQRLGLSSIKKEQVRDRQYGKCNMCFTQPSQWKYDYIDGNKSNNDLNNCQGLCPHCYSIKTERDNRVFTKNLLNSN
jgi:hypothetical protein